MTWNLPYDKTCKGCGDKMAGINDYKLRTLCEACGGNRTEYHVGNPNPEGETAKRGQRV